MLKCWFGFRHHWRIVGTFCDQQQHYVSGVPTGVGHYISGNYFVTHVTLQCVNCGTIKQKQVLGNFALEKRDTLAEALKYLEKS